MKKIMIETEQGTVSVDVEQNGALILMLEDGDEIKIPADEALRLLRFLEESIDERSG